MGHTYFSIHGFSLNEGDFPNIHLSWGFVGFYFYCAWTWRGIIHRRWYIGGKWNREDKPK